FGHEQIEALLGLGLDDGHLGAGGVLGDGQSGRRQQRGGGRGEAAQAQLSSSRRGPGVQVVELTADLLPAGEQLLGAVEQELTGPGEDEASAARFDEPDAEILRQGSQLVRYRRRRVCETVSDLGEGADFGEDAEDLEARIDHATLLHDLGEETSLFFVSSVADTVGTEHAPRLQLRGGIGDHDEVVDELTLAPENRIAAGDRETRNDIDRLIDGRRPGYSLPSPFYTSPDFFARDLEAIFASTWIFAASVAEVPEAGDFVTVDIGTYSVIIIRDDDGAIRAHHNACRHRGTRLLSDLTGSVGKIVCGYHQWTYTPGGDLISAGVQAPGFDMACFSLRPVEVRVIGGLIFICLSPTPPEDIDAVAAVIEPYIAGHDIAGAKVAAQSD